MKRELDLFIHVCAATIREKSPGGIGCRGGLESMFLLSADDGVFLQVKGVLDTQLIVVNQTGRERRA